jgi:hypothetical protein
VNRRRRPPSLPDPKTSFLKATSGMRNTGRTKTMCHLQFCDGGAVALLSSAVRRNLRLLTKTRQRHASLTHKSKSADATALCKLLITRRLRENISVSKSVVRKKDLVIVIFCQLLYQFQQPILTDYFILMFQWHTLPWSQDLVKFDKTIRDIIIWAQPCISTLYPFNLP